MPTVIDSLWVRLGFQADAKGMDAFHKKVESISSSVKTLGALAGIELVKRIGRFIESAIGGQAAIQKFSEATGIAAEEVAALGKVGFEADVTMEGVQGTLLSVASATGQAAMGIGRNVKLFQALGINAKDSTGKVKSSIDVLEELADKFQGMSASQRLAIAGRLGIDANMAAMMAEEGSAGFRSKYNAARSAGMLTNADYEQADKTEKAFERLNKTIKSITVVVANALAPWAEKVLNAFQGWWKENRKETIDQLKTGLGFIAEQIRKVWVFLGDAWGVGKNFVGILKEIGVHGTLIKTIVGAIVAYKVGGWAKDAAGGVAGLVRSFAGLKTSAILVGALVIGIGLLIEDLWVWHKGGQSFLKQLNEKWPVAFKLVVGLVLGLAASFAVAQLKGLSFLTSITKAIPGMTAANMGALGSITGIAAGMMAWYEVCNKFLVPKLLDLVGVTWSTLTVSQKLKDFMNQGTNQPGGFKAWSATGDDVDEDGNPSWLRKGTAAKSGALTRARLRATKATSGARNFMATNTQSMVPSYTPASGGAMMSSNTTSIGDVTFNIQSTDPRAVASEVNTGLKSLSRGRIGTARNAQSPVER